MQKPYARLCLYRGSVPFDRNTSVSPSQPKLYAATVQHVVGKISERDFILLRDCGNSLVGSIDDSIAMAFYVKTLFPDAEPEIQPDMSLNKRMGFEQVVLIPGQLETNKPQLVELLVASNIKPLLPIDTIFHITTEDTPEERRKRYGAHLMYYR